MFRSILLLAFLFVAARSVCQDSYLLRNVTVIPMSSEEVLAGRSVLIEDGRIKAIGVEGTIKQASPTPIDGTGKYLIPGLIDMHAHFFHEQGELRNTCEAELKLMLANGLTTARIMAGHPAYLEARENVRAKKWIGPELFVASPQFAGRWPWPQDFKNFEVVDSREKAASAVRRFRKEGYDQVKITFMVARDVYDEIIRVAAEEGIKVVGHVGPLVGLPAALAAGEQIEHMDEFIDRLLPDTTYNHGQSVSDMNIWRRNAWATVPFLDEKKLPALVRQVKEAGIYVTPTNFFFISCFGEGRTEEEFRGRPDYAFIPKAVLPEKWKIRDHYWNNAPPIESRRKYVSLRKKMTHDLWKAGVPLMAGSDSPEWFLVQGFSIHDELETFVDCGLTPFAALQTATVNPATFLEIAHRTGSIEVNKEADLVLLEKNPLEDIRNSRAIHGVFSGGKWYDKEALSRLLAEARTAMQ